MTGVGNTAIPAHVDVVGDDHTRYLVSVKPALVPTNSSRLLGSRGSRRSSLLLQSARQPFDDVKLGPLLGKGGFGRVYRAVWNGAAVACKVYSFPALGLTAKQPLPMLSAAIVMCWKILCSRHLLVLSCPTWCIGVLPFVLVACRS